METIIQSVEVKTSNGEFLIGFMEGSSKDTIQLSGVHGEVSFPTSDAESISALIISMSKGSFQQNTSNPADGA